MLLLFISCHLGGLCPLRAELPQERGFISTSLCFRAEPVLSRIQENRKRVILPSIDNIKQDTFEVQRYENSAHGYSWELWCMYISPPKDWWDAGDPSLPIRSVAGKLWWPLSPRSRRTEEPREGGWGRLRGRSAVCKCLLWEFGCPTSTEFCCFSYGFRGSFPNRNTKD